MSTNRFGYPDLDLRPPRMMRDTMVLWVQECPSCGYVASSLSNLTSVTAEELSSGEFRPKELEMLKSELAGRFYRQYLLLCHDGSEKAFDAALHAAWASDDRRDEAGAELCRRAALARFEGYLEKNKKRTADLDLVRMDLLRRVGDFDLLKKEYAQKLFKSEEHRAVCALQLKLAEAGDRACHTVGEAFDKK